MSVPRRKRAGAGRPSTGRAGAARTRGTRPPVPSRQVLRRKRGPAPSTADAGRRPPPAASLAVACARAADEHLGLDTLVVDLRGSSPIADWAVLTTSSSAPHARAVAEAVSDALHQAGARLHHREGDAASPWILLDASNVIIHIMDGVTRRTYDLERLWAAAPRIQWRVTPPPRARG